MKKDMPLEGLRWSRDSGSALYDTPQNGRSRTGCGDIEKARELQNFAQEVINVICHYRGNIVGGKRIMKLIGFDLGKNRTPFNNMTDEEEANMKKELEAIDFFNKCNLF